MPKRSWAEFARNQAGQLAVNTAFGLDPVSAAVLQYSADMRGYGMDVEASFPGAPPPQSEIGDAEQYEDPNFIVGVRNSKTAYGKRRRRDLKNAWSELDKSRATVVTRYQSFADDGFANGLGTHALVYNPTYEPGGVGTGVKQIFPMYAFLLNAYPSCRYTTVGGTANVVFKPRIGWNLRRLPNVSGTERGTYYWDQELVTANLANHTSSPPNTNSIVALTGWDPADQRWIKGFRHIWSDIRLTFYPRNSLATHVDIYLAKFKEEDCAFPFSVGCDNAGTDTTVYQHTQLPASEKLQLTAAGWDAHFGGTMTHPHNTNENPDKTNRPFKILKHERLFLPARSFEGDDGRPTVRVLKKLFWRNDRRYDTRVPQGTLDTQADLVGSYEHGAATAREQSCPFPRVDDQVFLIIEGAPYGAQGLTPGTAPTPLHISFDICMRNKYETRMGDRVVEGDVAAIP